MAWEIVVGLETHVQLLTRSKQFSGASTAFGAAPNTQASAVDIALPGTLPVLNRAAVEHAIRFGLAVKGRISPRSVFARKNYFYPDLPKGYQISQYEIPVVQGGEVEFFVGETPKKVRLTRAHLEEDAGKSLHELDDSHAGLGQEVTGIDLNRAGTPLLEIVSEPELRGAKEAVAYARALHALVVWIGICDGNMQEGSFRCDANVSVKRAGQPELGVRCEIKNLNSFRFMEQAIEYEARRQIELLEDGGVVEQETRLYDPVRNETRSMRTKEDAQDYRYFPDPDLLPLVISQKWIGEVEASLPELPGARQQRLEREYGVPAYQASLLTASREAADYYEALVKTSGVDPKICANWQTGELAAALNEHGLEIAASPIPAQVLGNILKRLADGTLSGKTAKKVFEVAWTLGPQAVVDEIIAREGLQQISDVGALEKVVDEVLAANPKQVEDYRAGKEKAFNSLVGQAMKATKGKANPAQVNEILRRKLSR
ncbi:MAG TPA: Asp-tRNA(Asn)/Glu-tRNA(Gln) amidotransferase subunit GatB [Burkholderiales bacterium]|nr:Asp-tRNA(Asn)/Glu-tRNA(Gln) amidotransferase subunit GatB [Burkholderiales bacterium]